MKIFKGEEAIKDILLKQNKTQVIASLSISEKKDDLLQKSIEAVHTDKTLTLEAQAATFSDTFDLTFCKAILVSTNWNKNDDIFLPEQTWAARKSPINKPFNDNHQKKNIIGHIIAYQVMDKDGGLIDTEATEVPEFFNIEVDAVVYKRIFPDETQAIEEGAKDGNKFVSMECVFGNFNYGLKDAEGNLKIVERNDETSFLTKHLKIYGGDGVYSKYRIGRVLEDIVFTGMGSVDTPANPDSKFTELNNVSVATASEILESKFYLYNIKEQIMKVETLEQAEKVITDLTKEVNDAKASTVTVSGEKTALQENLTVEQGKVELLTKKVGDLETKATESAKELETVKAELKTKADELEKIQAEAKLKTRLETLASFGFDKVTDEQKDKYAKMSDEAFSIMVDFGKNFKKEPEVKKDETQAAEKIIEGAEKVKENAEETTAGENKGEKESLMETAAGLVKMIRDERKKKTVKK